MYILQYLVSKECVKCYGRSDGLLIILRNWIVCLYHLPVSLCLNIMIVNRFLAIRDGLTTAGLGG